MDHKIFVRSIVVSSDSFVGCCIFLVFIFFAKVTTWGLIAGEFENTGVMSVRLLVGSLQWYRFWLTIDRFF